MTISNSPSTINLTGEVTDDPTVYVAGHRGLVGGAIWRAFEDKGGVDLVSRASGELDLRDRNATFEYVSDTRPDTVIISAGKVGGILANSTYPVDFLSDNVLIAINLLDACHAANVERVLYLGSSCIYPKMAPQPISEDSILTGPLEPTNEAYAIAKIAGILHVQGYRRQYGRSWVSAMPTNLYGPGDNFDTTAGHVLPSMIAKFHAASLSGEPVVLWGSGSPRREFLHVDDLANALLTILDKYDAPETINVGTGSDVSILELAHMISDSIGGDLQIEWDRSKPDGTPRKLLDVSRLNGLGWSPSIDLRDGISQTCAWYQENLVSTA